MRTHIKTLLSALSIFTISFITHAQADATGTSTREYQMDTLRVTASPIADYEENSLDGASGTIIGRRQIERLGAIDLPTALRQVPGAAISRYSAIGGYGGDAGGSIYIRGMGASRPGGEVKLYTEGVPREAGGWSHPILDTTPISFAEEVYLAKNPQPQNYPDTFGAADISLKRRREQGHEAQGGFTYGRHTTMLGTLSAGGKEGDLDYYLGIASSYSKGERLHNRSELLNYYFRLGADLTEQDYLSYIFLRTDNSVQDPGHSAYPTPLRDTFDTDTYTHILRWEHSDDYTQGFALFYYDDGAIRWHKDRLDSNPASPPGYSNSDWHNYGLRTSHDISLGNLTATVAIDWWSEGSNIRNILEANNMKVWGFKGRINTFAPYAALRYDLLLNDAWTLTPSLGTRYYRNDEFENEWAPVAALTLARDNLSFFSSHSRGVHYPGVFVRGISPHNWRTLEAEKLDTTEAGFHLRLSDDTSLHAVYYHASVDDRMEPTANGMLNIGSHTSDGFEISLHTRPFEQLSLFTGLGYAHARQRPATRLPEFTFSAGSSYQVVRHLRWDIDCQYVASQYAHNAREQNPVLEKIDDFFVVNTRLALDLLAVSKQSGEFFIGVENLNNTGYSYFPGYPMPKLMAYAGLSLDLW